VVRKRMPQVLIDAGLAVAPKETFGPKGGPTKPRPAVVKKKARARNKAAGRSRRTNR
jgi:hypothetical protein